MRAAQPSDVPVEGSGGNEAHRGAVEALARALAESDGWADIETIEAEDGEPLWRNYEENAERILADPGPLLEALATAGVLRTVRGVHHMDSGRSLVMYASEWRADG